MHPTGFEAMYLTGRLVAGPFLKRKQEHEAFTPWA